MATKMMVHLFDQKSHGGAKEEAMEVAKPADPEPEARGLVSCGALAVGRRVPFPASRATGIAVPAPGM